MPLPTGVLENSGPDPGDVWGQVTELESTVEGLRSANEKKREKIEAMAVELADASAAVSAQKKELGAQISALELQLQKQGRSDKENDASAAMLCAAVAAGEARIAELEKEAVALREDCVAAVGQAAAAENAAAAAGQEATAATAAAAKVEDALVLARNSLEEMEAQNAQLEGQLKSVHLRASERDAAADAQGAAALAELESERSSLTALEGRLAEAQASAASAAEVRSELEARIVSLEQECAREEERARQRVREAAAAGARCAELEGRVTDLERELAQSAELAAARGAAGSGVDEGACTGARGAVAAAELEQERSARAAAEARALVGCP